MTLEELKELFKNGGYLVDEINNIVILKVERDEISCRILSGDLEQLVSIWDNIIANRDKNGWNEILTRLGV